jgi:hypothetical protein
MTVSAVEIDFRRVHTMKVQLVAIDRNGKQTVINDTNDIAYLDRIIENTDGTVWIGSELCDLRVQIIN